MTDHAEPSSPPRAAHPWVYNHGTWARLGFDPAPDTPAANGDWEAMIKAAGYEPWFSSAPLEFSVPLAMHVYIRHAEGPHYLIDLQGDFTETAYAQHLPDVMDLIRQWSPALQAIAASAEISRGAQGDFPGVGRTHS